MLIDFQERFMTTVAGLAVPNFSVDATDGKQINLANYQGKYVVLYFYPKDSTPGCTAESKDFRDHYDQFEKLNAKIIGVSRDTVASHDKFKTKHCMPFDLISDRDEKLCEHFGVIGEKKMFGKAFRGLIRSTFLINPQGEVIHEWRKVKVRGHVADVLNTLSEYK